MRVLICGGRAFKDFDLMHEVMMTADFGEATLIIHGGAPGADTVADEWAKFVNLPVLRFPARWAELGRKAGPIRNRQMLAEGRPDVVVAFPGGRGTADMVWRAKAAGVKVFEVPPRDRIGS